MSTAQIALVVSGVLILLIVVVVIKVTFIDLRDMQIIVKVIALMAVGIILLLGSFAYIHSNKKFEREE